MIPVLAALPVVQGVLGGVVGSVANIFSSQPVAPAPSSSIPFSSAFSSASSAAAAATVSTSCGVMRSAQWNQMSGTELQSWAKGLTGRHIDATDAAGHAITGTVNSVTTTGGDLSFNINGHPVALSDLKQISWSATAAA
ncbi:MAG TPA: hypothetical protein VHY09_09300 [Candidatus Methylacidiphilales bacterium]|nr:hypothetical protein [Candidatus Methylacidiphilales bacterium]